MSDKTIELNRRRVLGGMITIGGAAAAAGAGTFALFSDTETSTGNTLSAGTLDLVQGSTSTLTFTGTDIKPTQSGIADTDLDNSGSISGDLSVAVTNVGSSEGDNPASEGDTDTTNGGELDDQLQVALWLGLGGGDDNKMDSGDIALESDGTTSTGSKVFDTAANYNSTNWSNVITGFSGPITFNVEWQFPDQGSTNNDAQGDTITMDFQFDLVQS